MFKRSGDTSLEPAISLQVPMPDKHVEVNAPLKDILGSKYAEAVRLAESDLGENARRGVIHPVDTPYERLFEQPWKKVWREVKELFVSSRIQYSDSILDRDRQSWDAYKIVFAQYSTRSLEKATGAELEQLRQEFNKLYLKAHQEMIRALQVGDLESYEQYSEVCKQMELAIKHARTQVGFRGSELTDEQHLYFFNEVDKKVEAAKDSEPVSNVEEQMVTMGSDFMDFLAANDLTAQGAASITGNESVIIPEYNAVATVMAQDHELVIPQPNDPRYTGLGIQPEPFRVPISDQFDVPVISVGSLFNPESPTERVGKPYKERLKDIFDALNQAGKQTVETHSLDYYFLPDAVGRGVWSLEFRGGFQTEQVSTVTDEFTNGRGQKTPIHSEYVNPSHWSAILIIDHDKVEQQYPMATHQEKGFRLVQKLDLKDDTLMYILVADPLRNGLLKWISTWPEARRTEVFGDRKPEELFVSDASQIKKDNPA